MIGTPCDASAMASGATIKGGLHLVGDQCFLDLRETLEETRKEDFAVIRVARDVVGHRAGELARYRNVRDDDFALIEWSVVVEDGGPVHVETGMKRGDYNEPRSAEEAKFWC